MKLMLQWCRSRFLPGVLSAPEDRHIWSRAARAELIGNDAQDGPNGTIRSSSDLVNIAKGGTLNIGNNIIEKAPRWCNENAKISIDGN
jgi:hypothetical protein